MSTRFFITGAQGFVGRYVIAHLVTSRPDAEVMGIGRSPALRDTFPHSIRWAGGRLPAPLPQDLERPLSEDRYCYASIDINARARTAQALRTFRPHVVIHLASGLRGDRPTDLFRTNVEGTLALVEAIADAAVDLRRLIVCSTGGVYAACDEARLPFGETAPCRPTDPYAVSKLEVERVSRLLSLRYGIATVWARLFNIVGAGEDDRHVGPELARQAAEIVHGLRPPVVEVGDLDSTRDFIDVRDVAHALSMLADRGAAGTTYNVATGKESSVGTLLDMVLDAAGLQGSVEIRRHSAKNLAVRRHVGDIRRLRALGFRPQFDLRESMRDLVSYYTATVASLACEVSVGPAPTGKRS